MAILRGADIMIGIGAFQLVFGVYLAVFGTDDDYLYEEKPEICIVIGIFSSLTSVSGLIFAIKPNKGALGFYFLTSFITLILSLIFIFVFEQIYSGFMILAFTSIGASISFNVYKKANTGDNVNGYHGFSHINQYQYNWQPPQPPPINPR